MRETFVTVIVPLYNKQDYIARTIRSVLAQTYQRFELVVVDDGSTDQSVSLVESLFSDARIRLVRQRNRGVSAARNRGLKDMQGHLAAFLDADDEWLPEHLADLVALVERFPDAALYSTNSTRQPSGAVSIPRSPQLAEHFLIDDYFSAAIRWPHFVNSSSTAVRRRVIDRLGGFVENVEIGEDQEYWARLALTGPLAVCLRSSSLYHDLLPGGATSRLQWRYRIPEAVRTLQNHLETCGEERRCAAIRSYIAWLCTNYAASGIVQGHAMDCELLLRSSLVQDPYVRWRVIALRVASRLPQWVLCRYIGMRQLRAFRPASSLTGNLIADVSTRGSEEL